jgi:hypothetical protein
MSPLDNKRSSTPLYIKHNAIVKITRMNKITVEDRSLKLCMCARLCVFVCVYIRLCQKSLYQIQ